MQKSGLSQREQHVLLKSLNSYKSAGYFAARSPQDIQEIITLARYALNDPRTSEIMKKNVLGVSYETKAHKDWIYVLLNDLIKRAEKKLRKLGGAPKKSQKITPALAHNIKNKENTLKIKEVVNPEPMQKPSPAQITREQVEEEQKLANRLYIGLDVKDHNTTGQRIMWQDTINSLANKITDAEFVPNDYFHITIAWYESNDPLSPETIAKVEHALANASQILKIVFPLGVTDVSLHDSAVLLGARRDSVAFRVAESSDLKKLQEIILKFLSFEKIEGFKFSTFDKDTPIHVTLGKIRPAKGAHQYHDAASGLNAPEGARASKKEGFTINTFRLTYSSAGHAWQEKMSYKF